MREVFSEYRYGPRGAIHEGQRFRVSGGPFYTTAEGQKLFMGLRGTFVFCRYVVEGRRRWIECTRPNEVTTERLPMSRSKAAVEGYTMRPYKVRALRRAAKRKADA